MCIVIDIDGSEFVVPDEVYLDSNNIRRTMQFLEAERRKWRKDWKEKKDQRQAKRRKSFWK